MKCFSFLNQTQTHLHKYNQQKIRANSCNHLKTRGISTLNLSGFENLTGLFRFASQNFPKPPALR